MTWGEFQAERDLYKRAWEEMRQSYADPIRGFLKQSRIVVSCGREFEIDADFSSALRVCPAFFINVPKIAGGSIDPEAFEISDGWRIEIKFPHVDIDFIQALKASPYCDKDKTFMRPSSTDVVLLPFANKAPCVGK
jgi:hypothetical protein